KESIIEKEAAEISAEVDKIKKEKEILEKELESILDNQKFIEPDNYDYEDSPLEWWEQLNLKSNPFPNTNGLTSIDENLYEKILVGTEPFQWMLKKLSTSSLDFFDKGYLIEGALG